MPKGKSTLADDESILWRGGERIAVEKQEDRFTVLARTEAQVEALRKVAGVQAIKRVNRQVCKVETTQTERDSVMAAMRSGAFGAVAHHAYKPAGSEGTVYYLTDKIVVTFGKKVTTAQIEALLTRHKLRLIKEYALPNTVLVQVTSASGANPLKIANRLIAEKIVTHAEPNLVNRHASASTPPDGLFKRQWHLHARRAPQLVAEASVDAPKARHRLHARAGYLDDRQRSSRRWLHAQQPIHRRLRRHVVRHASGRRRCGPGVERQPGAHGFASEGDLAEHGRQRRIVRGCAGNSPMTCWRICAKGLK
jgi:hypothetical protein